MYYPYLAGDCKIVEGEISPYLKDYDQENRVTREPFDFFYVNGVEFSIPSRSEPWGYSLKQSKGGVLEEGMYVKIYYVVSGNLNTIMRIETY
jgi:hypothetical protein